MTTNPQIQASSLIAGAVQMAGEPMTTDLPQESSKADDLLERYIAIHDLRFRAGDIKPLSEDEDKRMREEVAARAEEVIRNADSILKRGRAKFGWPHPVGR